MTRIFLKCCIVVLILSATLSANATLTVFTDRVSWQAAAGGGTGNLFQDFNSYTVDVQYNLSPISVGFLTLSDQFFRFFH